MEVGWNLSILETDSISETQIRCHGDQAAKQEMQMPPMESTMGKAEGGWAASSVQRYYDFN